MREDRRERAGMLAERSQIDVSTVLGNLPVDLAPRGDRESLLCAIQQWFLPAFDNDASYGSLGSNIEATSTANVSFTEA
jgi:hypothetical protein